LSDAQHRRRAPEMQRLGDGDEIPEVLQLHAGFP
jgi:hypothetical protein